MCYRLVYGSPSLHRDFSGQLPDFEAEPGRRRRGPSADLHALVDSLPEGLRSLHFTACRR